MAVAFCAGVSQVTLSTPGVRFPWFSVTRRTANALPLNEWVSRCCKALHLAPPALLCCLHDTGLKPTHVLVDSPPIDGVPVQPIVGGRTSNPLRLRVVFAVICFAS